MYNNPDGQEFKNCKEQGASFSDFKFLFINGNKRKEDPNSRLTDYESLIIKDGPKEAVTKICEEIEEILASENINPESIGIIYHPNPIGSRNVTRINYKADKWRKFIVLFNNLEKISTSNSTIEIEFVEKYSSNDSYYDKISELCNEEVSEDVIEKIWYHYSLREKIKWLNIRKHDLANNFLPLEIDLLGFQKTQFQDCYWNETSKQFKSYSKIGDKVNDLIFGNTENNVDGTNNISLKKILEDATENNLSSLKSWQEIEYLCSFSHDRCWDFFPLFLVALKFSLKTTIQEKADQFHTSYNCLSNYLQMLESEIVDSNEN